MTERNIYIIALEYGSKNMESGITYLEMLKHLESKNIKPNNEFEHYFHIWFYKNFWSKGITFSLSNGTGAGSEAQQYLSSHDNQKSVLTAQAYSEYLDYLKLQQTREDAKKAHKLALFAIWISICLGLIQILLDLIGK